MWGERWERLEVAQGVQAQGKPRQMCQELWDQLLSILKPHSGQQDWGGMEELIGNHWFVPTGHDRAALRDDLNRAIWSNIKLNPPNSDNKEICWANTPLYRSLRHILSRILQNNTSSHVLGVFSIRYNQIKYIIKLITSSMKEHYAQNNMLKLFYDKLEISYPLSSRYRREWNTFNWTYRMQNC